AARRRVYRAFRPVGLRRQRLWLWLVCRKLPRHTTALALRKHLQFFHEDRTVPRPKTKRDRADQSSRRGNFTHRRKTNRTVLVSSLFLCDLGAMKIVLRFRPSRDIILCWLKRHSDK